MKKKAIPENERLLDILAVAEKLSVCKRSVWRWSETGFFPAPIKLGKGGRCVRWRSSEVEAWL
jgi:predicted DNA-binding transcriptional regulator AlpA